MSICGFEGPAGTGKTTALISELESRLVQSPLAEHHRVLALTFMHGARRRLHHRLTAIRAVKGRFTCTTFDGFARGLCYRWQDRVRALGTRTPELSAFTEVCAAVSLLLEGQDVQRWCARSFPIVIVDEAQDLSSERLGILKGLSLEVNLLVAYDEFQCLDSALRPNPAATWCSAVSSPIVLTRVHRTESAPLLAAAQALRVGRGIDNLSGGNFKVLAANGPSIAATFLVNAVTWSGGGTVALVTPSLKGGFAEALVKNAGQKAWGKQRNGPFKFIWETTTDQEADHVCRCFGDIPVFNLDSLREALAENANSFWGKRLLERYRRQRNTTGTALVTHENVVAEVKNIFGEQQRYSSGFTSNFAAMTIHQAKNREFDGVVVVWPYTVGGDAESQRRLLYNAITRARRWCTVITQSVSQLDKPPFSYEQ
jgi:UvrD-like helicase family protein